MLWPLLVAAGVLAMLLLSVIAAPPYSPDSWALYELSQSVFGDFYRFSHWRSYASASPYSAAFPPLYPALIAVTDGLLGTGVRTGLYLAFASALAFALVSEQIGRRVTGAPWLGLATAGVLLLGPNMLVIELGAGRTIPLQLLIYALILWALLKGQARTLAGAALVGALAGLALMNRFDAVLVPAVAAGAVLWLSRKPSHALAALAAAGLVVSPWVAYSLATFGTVFATDNAGAAFTIDPQAYVNDWWPIAQPTIADDPLAWAARVAGNAVGFLRTVASLIASPLGLGGAVMLGAAAVQVWLAGHRPRGNAQLWVLTGFLLVTALMMTPQVLTGYLEHRYLTTPFWALFLAIGCWGVAQGATRHQRAVFARLSALGIGFLVAGLGAWQLVQAGPPDTRAWANFDAQADVRALKTCVKNTPGARILVLGDDKFAARAGAMGGLATMQAPRNMVEGRLDAEVSRAFIAVWNVDYVLAKDPALARWAAGTFAGVPVTGCPLPLYRLGR
jgi:hypothetical protein